MYLSIYIQFVEFQNVVFKMKAKRLEWGPCSTDSEEGRFIIIFIGNLTLWTQRERERDGKDR
jgi:hypothetical protein